MQGKIVGEKYLISRGVSSSTTSISTNTGVTNRLFKIKMPMNVASIAHGAIILNYKQAMLESLMINHIVKKRHFSIWTQIFAQMFE
jgi:hypothetical protein